MLPFAALPFSLARIALYCVMASVLLLGVYRLTKQSAPDWSRSARIAVLLAAQQSITILWGLGMLQVAPLITGLFALFLTASAQERETFMTVLTILALCLKLTLGFPFLLFAALAGRFRVVALSLAGFLLVNTAGLARVGGTGALPDYARQVATVQALGGNAPDPYLPGSFERIDLEYLLNGLRHGLRFSHGAALALSGLALVFLFWVAWQTRTRRDTPEWGTAFAAPVVCLSLLAVYHHKYDAAILLIPLLLAIRFHSAQESRSARRIFLVAAVLLTCVYPVGRVFAVPLAHLLNTPPLIVERLSYSFLLTLAFAAALKNLFLFVRALQGDTASNGL